MTSPVGPASGASTASPPDDAPLVMGAVWDDFDGPAGAKPSSALWNVDLINQGGIQTYTSDNVYLDGNGHLVLKANKNQGNYVSGRLCSRRRFNMQYGRISASIQFPAGQGIWPAFWMLGVNYPNDAEVDIIEMVNNATAYYSTLITNHTAGSQAVQVKNTGVDVSQGFHEYWMEWQKNHIKIGMDGMTWADWTPTSLPAGAVWDSFNAPMYVTLNVAIGGNWAGPPDATTPWPSIMLVDWFRYTPWVSAPGGSSAATIAPGITADPLTNSVATLPRWAANAAPSVLGPSGQQGWVYFTADKDITVSNLEAVNGLAAAATPSVCRMGLYSVADSGDLTLIGSVPNDPTLFSTANTAWVRPLSTPVSLVSGQRYALSILVVSTAGVPTFKGAGGLDLSTVTPVLAKVLAGQTDLAASVPAANLRGSVAVAYMRAF